MFEASNINFLEILNPSKLERFCWLISFAVRSPCIWFHTVKSMAPASSYIGLGAKGRLTPVKIELGSRLGSHWDPALYPTGIFGRDPSPHLLGSQSISHHIPLGSQYTSNRDPSTHPTGIPVHIPPGSQYTSNRDPSPYLTGIPPYPTGIPVKSGIFGRDPGLHDWDPSSHPTGMLK